MLATSFRDSIQRAVSEHERVLEVVSTRSQQLAEFQYATVEPLKTRLRQMMRLIRDETHKIEDDIANLQHLIDSRERQRDCLIETLMIRQQESNNARQRAAIFGIASPLETRVF
jgi:septal ring factor EnvC (AmiA/AmiB activator)